MAKRRRFKGFRWRKIGHGEMQEKERSFIGEDDNESEKDEVLNLVAFGAHKDEASTSSESYSESEERKYDERQDVDLKECYKQVCGKLVKLGKENMVLVKEQRLKSSSFDLRLRGSQPDVQQLGNVSVYQIAHEFISFFCHCSKVIQEWIRDVSAATQVQAVVPRVLLREIMWYEM
ncbi:hypothetical protein F2Q69_00053135 [Brassica cretica]|uniref:Uncharacterized protein n=1 Tax=Brassica cretica TaxID=69181 RepID=A0A8S9MPP1_BRACR|nr:hypothetical protein F2Q69_00053135 [Brassica cretica]